MYRASDYLADVGRFLRTGDRAHLDEFPYLIRAWRYGWRCRVGLHYPEWDPNAGQSFYDPGEPGWVCAQCMTDKEPVFPVRIRLALAFWESPMGRAVIALERIVKGGHQ